MIIALRYFRNRLLSQPMHGIAAPTPMQSFVEAQGMSVVRDFYGWTAVTRDRSLSAQLEHSVGVTATGVEIFTLSQRNGEKPLAGA